MWSQKFSKLRRQPPSTWALLHKHLITLPDPSASIFPDEVWNFIKLKADSLSTCTGFLVPCLLKTTSFMAAMNSSSNVEFGTNRMPLNLYTIFAEPPATGGGKSQALKACALNPMSAIREDADGGNVVIQKCTSSGLFKTLAKQKKAFLLSAEVYDVMRKLLKSDKETATGDVQILCEMFSGEATSYRYATEAARESGENTPFCILGSTQVPFAARIISQLDQGHGLLDRFLFSFPNCLRPSTEATDAAIAIWDAGHYPVKSTSDIFVEMGRLCGNKRTYTFSQDAQRHLKELQESCIREINAAIQEGRSPPKSKKADLVMRLSVAIHIFVHVAQNLLLGTHPGQPLLEVSQSTLEKAIKYVEWAA